jgi:hypothetical protein
MRADAQTDRRGETNISFQHCFTKAPENGYQSLSAPQSPIIEKPVSGRRRLLY